jgi:hypothetical protein
MCNQMSEIPESHILTLGNFPVLAEAHLLTVCHKVFIEYLITASLRCAGAKGREWLTAPKGC